MRTLSDAIDLAIGLVGLARLAAEHQRHQLGRALRAVHEDVEGAVLEARLRFEELAARIDEVPERLLWHAYALAATAPLIAHAPLVKQRGGEYTHPPARDIVQSVVDFADGVIEVRRKRRAS